MLTESFLYCTSARQTKNVTVMLEGPRYAPLYSHKKLISLKRLLIET